MENVCAGIERVEERLWVEIGCGMQVACMASCAISTGLRPSLAAPAAAPDISCGGPLLLTRWRAVQHSASKLVARRHSTAQHSAVQARSKEAQHSTGQHSTVQARNKEAQHSTVQCCAST